MNAIEKNAFELMRNRQTEALINFFKDRQFDLNVVDEYNNTLLIWAVVNKDKKVVDFLLEKGADPNIQNYDKMTALHYAVQMGRTEIAKSLLKNGADKEIKNKDGKTPMQCANKSLIGEFVKVFVEIELEECEK